MQATKTVNKPAAKTIVRKAAPKVKAPVIAYGVHNGYRPGAGKLLQAYTTAWLTASGLLAGKTYAKAEAVQVAGATAIAYHLGNGNLEDTKGVLKLSGKGKTFFVERNADAKLVEAFTVALKTGQPNADIGFKVPGAFRPVTL